MPKTPQPVSRIAKEACALSIYRFFSGFFWILSHSLYNRDTVMTGTHSTILTPLWTLPLTAALISGCADRTVAPAPAELRPLIETMHQRLDIANDVAQSKFYSGKPVQDNERERLVIDNAQAQAATYGLDKADVRQFMNAQIEANKMVQYARIEHWHATLAPEKPTHNLTTGIRARLDTLQPLMMQNYAAFQPYRKDSACPHWVDSEVQRLASDPIVVSALQRAAANLCVTASDH
ncbi:chorismate mutase [Pseudomonas sp. NPDC088444]|uniref:chorismate mutase n=1 Tax=Pseudomonas sp. NPDC088444 TaxID=3364456 RepID=UPI0038509215